MIKLIKDSVPNAKNDIISGLTVALALVPEAVAFAFVAGVDPLVGLYAAFMIGLITSIFGRLSTIDLACHRPKPFRNPYSYRQQSSSFFRRDVESPSTIDCFFEICKTPTRVYCFAIGFGK